MEGLGGFRHHIGQRNLHQLQRGSALLHPGKAHKVIGQVGKPSDIVLNVRQPLILTQLHFQHIRIRLNDG